MPTQIKKPVMSRRMVERMKKGFAVEFFYPDRMIADGKPWLAFAATKAKRDAWIAGARKQGVLCNIVVA